MHGCMNGQRAGTSVHVNQHHETVEKLAAVQNLGRLWRVFIIGLLRCDSI